MQQRNQQEEHHRAAGKRTAYQERHVLQPGVQWPGENHRRKGHEKPVKPFVGQGAGQRIAPVLLGFGQLFGRHAGLLAGVSPPSICRGGLGPRSSGVCRFQPNSLVLRWERGKGFFARYKSGAKDFSRKDANSGRENGGRENTWDGTGVGAETLTALPWFPSDHLSCHHLPYFFFAASRRCVRLPSRRSWYGLCQSYNLRYCTQLC